MSHVLPPSSGSTGQSSNRSLGGGADALPWAARWRLLLAWTLPYPSPAAPPSNHRGQTSWGQPRFQSHLPGAERLMKRKASKFGSLPKDASG